MTGGNLVRTCCQGGDSKEQDCAWVLPALALTCLHPPVPLGLCRVAAGVLGLQRPPPHRLDCPPLGCPCLASCPAADFPLPTPGGASLHGPGLGGSSWPCCSGLSWQLFSGFSDVVACSGLTPHLPAGERGACKEAEHGPEPLRAQSKRTSAPPSGLSCLAGWEQRGQGPGCVAAAACLWPCPAEARSSGPTSSCSGEQQRPTPPPRCPLP